MSGQGLPRDLFEGLEEARELINGAEHFHQLIASYVDQGLPQIISHGNHRCEEVQTDGCIHYSVVWSDAELSSNFVPTCHKYCTPKQPCSRWFCSCAKNVRAAQSKAPVLGIPVAFELQPSPIPRSPART